MYKFLGLVLLSALAAVGARRVDLNAPLDQLMEKLNNQQRQQGTISASVPEISLGPTVKYSGAGFIGYDSLKRTADSWQEIKGNEILNDISYGFGLMTLVLPHLEVAGKNMSAYARIRDNSLHLSFTASLTQRKCQVKLNELRIEKLENVEFGASDPEYDGSNVDGFFKLVVIPTVNGIVESNFARIEDYLQGLCNVKDYQNVDNVHDILTSLF